MKFKKVLITGGCGFIGSHLTELLIKKNYDVTVYDKYSSFNEYGNLKDSKYKKHIKFYFGDIRDFDLTNQIIKNKDIVIHLAALIGIPYSYISPSAYISTNINGTHNILEACRANNVEQVIITSTSEVYGSAKMKSMSESHSLNAQSPYAATKIAADQLSMSYYNSFSLPVKIIRPFNAYGPRQSQRAVIPTIISQSINSNEIKLGNINSMRDYTYVEDLSDAFLSVIKSKLLLGQVVNVGTNKTFSIKKIVDIVSKSLQKKIIIKTDKKRIRPTKSEVSKLICNNKKIKKLTNWEAKHTFINGILKTINWYKSNHSYDNFQTKYHI